MICLVSIRKKFSSEKVNNQVKQLSVYSSSCKYISLAGSFSLLCFLFVSSRQKCMAKKQKEIEKESQGRKVRPLKKGRTIHKLSHMCGPSNLQIKNRQDTNANELDFNQHILYTIKKSLLNTFYHFVIIILILYKKDKYKRKDKGCCLGKLIY